MSDRNENIIFGIFIVLVVLFVATVALGVEPIPQAVSSQIYNVCKITSYERGSQSVGSGCYLGDRLVLTCHHVVGNGYRLVCAFPSESRSIPGRVLKTDPHWDCALVELQQSPTYAKGVPLAAVDPTTSAWVYPTGYPGSNIRATIRPARVLGFSHSLQSRNRNWIRTSSYVWGGCSGGPIFNDRGQLIGNLWGSRQAGNDSSVTGVRATYTRGFLRPWLMRLKSVEIASEVPPAPVQQPDGTYRQAEEYPANTFGICRPGYCPPPITRPPTGRSCNCNVDEIVNQVIDRIRSDPSLRGPAGPQGPAGMITESQLTAVTQAIYERIKVDPAFKGPAGPAGSPGTITSENIESITENIYTRIQTDPSFRGEQGPQGPEGPAGTIDEEQLKLTLLAALPPLLLQNETFIRGVQDRLDPIEVERYDANSRLIDSERYPYPGPIRLRYKP